MGELGRGQRVVDESRVAASAAMNCRIVMRRELPQGEARKRSRLPPAERPGVRRAMHRPIAADPERFVPARDEVKRGQRLASEDLPLPEILHAMFRPTPYPPPGLPTERLDLGGMAMDSSWAHASGWAQLSGSKRTLSCLAPCLASHELLQDLLPALSDTLTECGYPWEAILIDPGTSRETSRWLRAWSDLPGFRCVAMGSSQFGAAALGAGLGAARGDAVLVIDPDSADAVASIPRMVMAWEDDALLVYASRGGPHRDEIMLSRWNEPNIRDRIARGDFSLPAEVTQLGLIDRRLVDWLWPQHASRSR